MKLFAVYSVLKYQDKTKTRLLYSRSRSRQDQKRQDQDKPRLVQKIQETLTRVLKILMS